MDSRIASHQTAEVARQLMRLRNQPRGRHRIQARLAVQFPEHEPAPQLSLFRLEPQMGRTKTGVIARWTAGRSAQ
jgi:hypothetical protein